MQTLHVRTFVLPIPPSTRRTSRRLPVPQRPGFSGAYRLASYGIKPQRPTPSTVVRAKGEAFTSEAVLQKMKRLSEEFAALSALEAKFPDFDLEGKRSYLQQADALMDRLKMLDVRLKRMDDPMAKGIKRQMDKKLRKANMPREVMFETMERTVEVLRGIVEEEERTSDPEMLQTLRMISRRVVVGPQGTLQERVLMLAASGDLTFAEMQAFEHPTAVDAIGEVLEDPLALLKYRDRPGMYSLMKKLIFAVEE